MKRRTVSLLMAVSLLVIAPAHAQDQPAQGRPPVQRPAAGGEQAAPLPLPPAQAAAIRRREENSVDLEDLVAQVAASSHKVFLVDPRVRARVFTVPRIDKPTYADLLSILRLNGYMAVEIGGRVNVVPDANARGMPVRLLQRDDASVPDDEWVTRVITVPNAGQLVPVLRPLMPQGAHLSATAAEGPNTKLIIVDTYANVRRMTELIKTLSP